MTPISLAICVLVLLSALSYLVASTLIPLLIKNARRWGILDIPNHRKRHKRPMPRLGGLAFAPSLWASISLALAASTPLMSIHGAEHFPIFDQMLTGLLIGITGFFLLGSFDDFKSIRVRYKLMIQVSIALIVMLFLPSSTSIMGLECPLWLTQFLIFGWLVVIPNSVNLLDGIDGLTCTLVLAFLLTVSILALITYQPGWLLVSVSVAAACLAFLRFNWNPAKIFLGDSGSLGLGFLVAYLSLAFALSQKNAAYDLDPRIALLLTSPWVFDTTLAICRRASSRFPQSEFFARRSLSRYFELFRLSIAQIWVPDSDHIHHKLIRYGFSVRRTVYILAGLGLSSMLLSLPLVVQTRSSSVSEAMNALLLVIAGALSVSLVKLSANSRRQKSP